MEKKKKRFIKTPYGSFNFKLGVNPYDKCQTLSYTVNTTYDRNFAGQGNEFSTTQTHGEEVDLPEGNWAIQEITDKGVSLLSSHN